MGVVVAVFFLFSVAVAFTLNKNLAQEDPNSLAEEYGLLNDEDENKLGLLDDENDEPGLSDDEDEFEPGLSDHKEENEAGLLNYMQNKEVENNEGPADNEHDTNLGCPCLFFCGSCYCCIA
ncbi:unnamed protein product [Porites evermanni]|uniref:Uncharacterized protein n=1 Tax=Porites evermanni TaxID=104178 RepID=A0ABN8QHL9_9CNID|nr:unnamed protein product [Porites evermanni]